MLKKELSTRIAGIEQHVLNGKTLSNGQVALIDIAFDQVTLTHEKKLFNRLIARLGL